MEKRDEWLRLWLLWEEGLLCRRCHSELHQRSEIEAGMCQNCAAFVERIEAQWAKGGAEW